MVVKLSFQTDFTIKRFMLGGNSEINCGDLEEML